MNEPQRVYCTGRPNHKLNATNLRAWLTESKPTPDQARAEIRRLVAGDYLAKGDAVELEREAGR